MRLRHLRGDGRHVDENGTGLHVIQRTAIEEDLAHHRTAVENRKNVVSSLDRFCGRLSDGAPRLQDWRSLARGAVPSHDIEPSAHQINSHGCAHYSQAKKGNRGH